MGFHTKSDHVAMSEINVTPLVDVMLVLLIVFIVTAPLLMQAIPVKLPKTAPVAPVSKPNHIHISINRQGTVFLEKQPITPDALEAELKSKVQHDPDISVQLNADENINYGKVAEVMALVQHAGISKLAMVTQERR